MRTLFVILLVAAAPQLLACTVLKETSLAEKFAQAEHVALVKIVSARIATKDLGNGSRDIVEATYLVLESFKGDHDEPIAREPVFGPGNCTLGLLVGNSYVLFLNDPHRIAGWPGGSFMVWNVEGTKVKPVLDDIRKLRGE